MRGRRENKREEEEERRGVGGDRTRIRDEMMSWSVSLL